METIEQLRARLTEQQATTWHIARAIHREAGNRLSCLWYTTFAVAKAHLPAKLAYVAQQAAAEFKCLYARMLPEMEGDQFL